MKKLIAILLLALVAGLAFSESIDENDGWDWINSSETFKIGYVVGWLSALSALGDSMVEAGMTPRDADEICWVSGTVIEIVRRISLFYGDVENRKVPMHYAFLFVNGLYANWFRP